MTTFNPIIFEIASNDLNGLIQEGLRFTWGSGSLYHQAKQENSLDLTLYSDLIANESFKKAAQILSSPDYWIIQRTGGGQTVMQSAHVYYSTSVDNCVVLITLDQTSDNYLINLHESIASYIQWIADTFCNDSRELAVNYMPPNLTLPQFYMVLHLIDAYRRITYTNMLNYQYDTLPKISATEFYSTLSTSLETEDIRWLLPSLEHLVPSLKSLNYSLNPDDIKILFELDFLDGILPDDQGGDLVLSHIGIYNGIEFFKHWILSLGFEIYKITDSDIVNISQLYLAPTRLTNHYITFETADSGDVMVNHQVMTKELLMFKFKELLQNLFVTDEVQIINAVAATVTNTTPVVTAPTATPVTTAPTATPAPSAPFCTQCGNPLPLGAKFCTSCGTPVNN